MSAGTGLGARVGRHTVLYASGTAVSVLVSIATIAVFTRYLAPADFGELALFLLVATVLTYLYNLGSLQGIYMSVYGSTGEEDVPDEADEAPVSDRRATMGTGIVLTAFLALAGTLIVVLVAPGFAQLLTGDRDDATEVIVAAVLGALGAVWRLISNIPRMERRPLAFVVLLNLRRVLATGLGVVLVTRGHGPLGALVGAAAGTAVSMVLGLFVVRQSFRMALRASDAVRILRRGAVYVPVVAAIVFVQTSDVFLVSRYASVADTGIYRVATAIGALMSYAVSAFVFAWGPLQRTPAFLAIDRDRDSGSFRGLILTYFVVAAVGALVALTALADVLVEVAGDEYSGAARLVPFAGLSFLLSGSYLVVYMSVRFAARREAYPKLAVTAAAIFLAGALILIPAIGPVGALVAIAVGYATAIGGLLVLSQRGTLPLKVDRWRIVVSVALGAACVAVGHPSLMGNLSSVTAPLGLVAYPLLVVATGVVDRRHLRSLGRVARLALLPRREANLGQRMESLGEEDRAKLRHLAREGWSTSAVAATTGRAESEVLEDLVRMLRQLGRLEPPGPYDEQIGAYLVSPESVADREQLARVLYGVGVDPRDLDGVERMFGEVRRVRPRRWNPKPALDEH